MNRLGWGLFLILTFVITLPMSWWVLAKANFTYAYLHDAINISENIDRYAPKNINGKLHFESTSKDTRVALFKGIVDAIQQQGKGLTELSYLDPNTQSSIRLLTVAEVTHLQDVANLIDKLKVMVFALAIFWLIVVLILWKRRKALPSAVQLLISATLIIVLCGAILSIGPEAIFNQLHIWIFPKNHQWFFYYEESLMSTMMKAPDLFAYIAGMMALLSLFLTTIIIKLLKVLIPKCS